MNDLESLDELWPAPDAPSPASRAAARSALMDRITLASTPEALASEAPAPAPVPAPSRRRGRRRWVFGLVAVGAAAATAAAAFAMAPASEHRGGGRVKLVSANIVLDRAAAAAERRPFQAPRPDQWMFIEERGVTDQLALKPGPYSLLGLSRRWIRGDGTQEVSWDARSKKLAPAQHPVGRSLVGGYTYISKLPTDPDALNAAAREQFPKNWPESTKKQMAHSYLSGILAESMPPPALQAAIYKALKRTPGARVDLAAKDPVGRPAIAISWYFGGDLRSELLIDPSSYAYLGSRMTALKPLTRPRSTGTVVLPAGTVLTAGVRLRSAIVDRAGQLPG
ncbi:CU044_5270 family protein [Actinomadura harenae]|uniref:CU044_5270 family protein n=1 Tax=Actinomadura harenae TaxID=2483351 RepID=A0A3M2LUJ2_9ACTN|nr:CU044_5270 family protein [Actinomadura harenae]RMI41159.1 hypothetical protein EBO15_23805 [Actinomadura harenae]